MLRRLAVFSLAIAASACGSGDRGGGAAVPAQAQGASPAATPTAPPAEAEAPPFQAPDAAGWGRAAGLRYLERCLGGARPDDALPLVIMIHGLGDRPSF